MSVISLRVNNDEKAILEEACKIYGCGMSSMIKHLLFEKIEDEYDLRVINEYEEAKSNDSIKTRPIEELWKEIGL